MSEIYRRGIKMYDVNFDASSSIKREIMKVDELSLSFSSSVRLSIKRGDYVNVDDEVFVFCEEPNETLNNRGNYTYEAKLYSEAKYLEYTLFMFLDEDSTTERIYCTQSEFDLTATTEEFLDLICRNLNRVLKLKWSYSVDSSFDRTKTCNITFQNSNCMEALNSLCDEMELEWNIIDRCINVSEKIEKGTGVTLSYPENLTSPIELKHEDVDATCTRLFVFGGERNIPSDYNDGRSDRLLMTGKTEFLQRTADFNIEKVKIFDDIYPRRNSFIDKVSVSESGFYHVTDSTINFNINDLLTDNTAKISFTSGNLVGYEFEIASYNNLTKTIEIKQQTEGDVVIPNEIMCPKSGDKYVLLDINMPNEYVANAEAELYTEAKKYFDEYCYDNVSATVNVSSIWLLNKNVNIAPYDMVRLYDEELEIDRSIRVVKVQKYPFDYASFGRKQEITLSDFVSSSKIDLISGTLSNVSGKVYNYYKTQKSTNETITSNVNNLSVSVTWKEGDE